MSSALSAVKKLVKSEEMGKPEGEGGNVRDDQERNDQDQDERKCGFGDMLHGKVREVGSHIEIQGNGRGYGTDRQSATFLYRKKTSRV